MRMHTYVLISILHRDATINELEEQLIGGREETEEMLKMVQVILQLMIICLCSAC